ncbi:MAG: transglutaminase domain-containing protein [Candidatus Lokiarchaeota archaeon]|nr:transglutaminase domain-containing protein [Candidatus Lokiarchaeota archaeon]
MSSRSDTRTAESRRKSEKRYVRHPFLTFILLFSLVFSALIIFSILPFSFFLNMNDPTFRFEDFPEGSIDFDFDPDEFEIPPWLYDWMDLFDNLPENLDLNGLIDFLMNTKIFTASPLNNPHKWRGEIYDIYDGTDDWGKYNSTFVNVGFVPLGNGLGNNRSKTLTFSTLKFQKETYQIIVPHYDLEDGIYGISDITTTYNDSHPLGADYYEIVEKDDYGSFQITCGPLDPNYDVEVNITIEYEIKTLGDYANVQSTNSTGISSAILTRYTQIPSSPMFNWSKVEQLADDLEAEINAENGSIYKKAVYVENWLQKNYNYSYMYYRYPELFTLPSDQDATYNFLFERGGDPIIVNGREYIRTDDSIDGEGICMDYAKAHVMLLRLMGVPARYVEGFQVYEYTRDISTNVETVYAVQRHAWSEVYLPISSSAGIWYVFDPTGISESFGQLIPENPDVGEEMPTGEDVFSGGEGGFGEGIGGSGNGTGGIGGGEGIWAIGTDPYGDSSYNVTVSSSDPNRYYKITAFDYYDGITWTQSNGTIFPAAELNFTSYTPGDLLYNVSMEINVTQNGALSIPLITLANFNSSRGIPRIIQNSLIIHSDPSKYVFNYILSNSYGGAILNMTFLNILSPYIFSFSYNITCDSIDSSLIKSKVPNDPTLSNTGMPTTMIDYKQIPSTVKPLLDALNLDDYKLDDVYNTTLNLIEYLKTNYAFTPLIGKADYNILTFLNTKMGTSGDFATALTMFLRYLNISSRLVWGGVGYDENGFSRRITNQHYWVEVWVPSTPVNQGNGYWIQFDPTPFPMNMWDAVNSSWFAPRVLDSQMETSHYDMFIERNVSGIEGFVSKGDTIEFIICIYKNNNTHVIYDSINRVNQTLGGSNINIDFYEACLDYYFAQDIPINSTGYANANLHFNQSYSIGVYEIVASYSQLLNFTIVSIDGPTNITVNYVNPKNITRASEQFMVQGQLLDKSTNKQINGVYVKVNTSETFMPNETITDSNGNYIDTCIVPLTHSHGDYNITAYFNGTVNKIYLYPYNNSIILPARVNLVEAESVSQEIAGITNVSIVNGSNMDNLHIYVQGSPSFKIIKGDNTIYTGNLYYDNGLPIPSETVWFGWDNSTGFYYVASNITQSDGSFFLNHTVPEDHDSNNVDMYVIFSSSNPYLLSCNGTTDPIPMTPVNVNISSATPQNVTIDQTLLNVSGYILDNNTGEGIAGLEIYLTLNGTSITSQTFITNSIPGYEGNFTASLIVPPGFMAGVYNISINSSDFINYPIKIEYEELKYINLKTDTKIPATSIYVNNGLYNPSSLVYVQRQEQLEIRGTLMDVFNQHLGSGREVFFYLDSLIGSDLTDFNGEFNFQYVIPLNSPLNASEIKIEFEGTDYYGNCSTNITVYIFHNASLTINVNPTVNVHMNSLITVSGIVTDDFGNVIKRRRVFIDFNQSLLPIQDGGMTNEIGFYSYTNNSIHPWGTYNCSVIFLGAIPKNSSNISFNVNAFTLIQNLELKNLNSSDPDNLFIQRGENIYVKGQLYLAFDPFSPYGPWDSSQFGSVDIDIYLESTHIGTCSIGANGWFSGTFVTPNNAITGECDINASYAGQPYVNPTSTLKGIKVFSNNSADISISLTVNGIDVVNNQVSMKIGDTATLQGRVISVAFPNGIEYRKISIFVDETQEVQTLFTTSNGNFNPSPIILSQIESLGLHNISAMLIGNVNISMKINVQNNIKVNHTPSFSSSEIQNPDIHSLAYQNVGSNILYYYQGEMVRIRGDLFQTNPLFPLSSLNVSIYGSSGLLVSQNTIVDGSYSLSFNTSVLPLELNELTIKYNPIGEYNDSTFYTVSIYVFNQVILTLNTPPSGYIGDSVAFSGNFSDGTNPIIGRRVDVLLINPIGISGISEATTDSGLFTYGFVIPATGLNQSFFVEFYDQSGIFRGNSTIITVLNLGTRPAPPFDPIPLIIILIVAICSVLGVVAVRKVLSIQKEKKAKEVDVKRIKNKLDLLLDGQRYREAIIYNFENLLYLIKGYLKRSPGPGETYREFINDLIKNVRTYISPKLFLPFVGIYEEARWSNHPITFEMFKESEDYYNKLFKQIVGLTPEDYVAKKEEKIEPASPLSPIPTEVEQKITS